MTEIQKEEVNLMDYKKIKLWDRRAFIVSISGFFIVLFALLAWVEYVMLPEGYQFEKLSRIHDVFTCCNGDGRYAKSWVGNRQINCGAATYFAIISRPGDACFEAINFNGRLVTIELVKVPAIGEDYLTVSKIESYGQIIYEKNEMRLRKSWIFNSRRVREHIFHLLVFL